MEGLHKTSIFADEAKIWSWFCREINSSDVTTQPDSLLNLPEGEVQECVNNVNAFFLHLIFFLLAFVGLMCRGYCCDFRKVNSLYLIRWPGHTIRWLLSFLLLLCALASLGEGILTEMGRNEAAHIRHQFYLPACMLFLATVASLMYYQAAETYKTPGMCWLLLIYWLLCIGVNVARITVLYNQQVDIDAAILWITGLMMIAYFFLVVLEIKLIVTKVCTIPGRQLNGDEVNYEDMRYIENYVPFLYYITFWWMNWLLKLGFRRPLEIEDLGSLPDNHRSQHLYQIFKEEFHKESVDKMSIGQKPSVWKVFGRVYKKEIFFAGLTRLVYELSCLVGPLALNGAVAYAAAYGQSSGKVESKQYVTVQEFFSNGFILVVVIFIANVIQYFSFQQNVYLSNVVGVHIRTSLQTMVYDKSLRLSSYVISGGSMTVGQITNHMSVDASNMFFFSQKMQYLWAVPFRLISVACLLYLQVELATFLAFGTLLIAVPTQLITTRLQALKQKIVMKLADNRLKRSNEMLLGIKLLKLYGWEEMFCKAIEAVRKMEMSAVFKYNGCYCFNVWVVQCTPVVMNLAVFASYPYITGKTLEPNTTFAALALMNLLMEPMYFVPMVTSLLVNAFVASRRLQIFFLAPETERSREVDWREHFTSKQKRPTTLLHPVKIHDEKTPLMTKDPSTTDYESIVSTTDREAARSSGRSTDPYAIKIQNGSFTWDNESSIPILEDINLKIPHGELTMVVGPVGSGKSSLLSAILGEMTTLNGSVTFGARTNGNGSLPSSGVAYAAQKAWLMNASLRDNVLFGQPFNKGRYQKIVDACALKPDIDILPGGDMTEIGEKGINLSGGQKQRVNVARTMYSNKPIVLLDDPLSALDVNVGGHLLRKGIMGRLRKANRTVVLVTHQLQYLQMAEKIIVMEAGRISFQGTFDDIAREEPELYQKWQQDVIAASESELSSGLSGEESTMEERETLRRQVSRAKNEKRKGKLIQKEELARGSVAKDVYWYYIRNMGLFWAFALPFGRMAFEAFNISKNFVLSDWSDAGLTNKTVNQINREFLGTYIGLVVACFCMSAVTCSSLLFSTWNAAKGLYLRMLCNIARTPMRFFDTTPIGRILNRFSSDTQIIDTKLVITFSTLMNFFWTFVAAVFVNCIITPVFLAEIIPVIIIYVVLAMYFIRSSRELQRLDSVTRSPVFSHFSETLGGLTTLRAYREQKRFFSNLMKRMDTNITAFMYLQASYSWLGLQMSICGGLVVLMVGLTTLLQATVFGNLDASSVGLALSYVLLVSLQLFNLVRSAADTEMQMNPVERVQFYASVPNENYDGSEPLPDWPSRGEIKIDHISVRYAENLPPVLQDVSLTVQPGEKVGICGRTGSGKSSLTLALLRIIQTFKGKIIIDGENIAELALTSLRQRLSIIPQDPILFTGSIRSNLDPNGTKSARELWNALEIAQLKPLISETVLGLDTLVTEGGENFSVGQRQLFCLARAFLRNSRVLIMDEATASIDYDTEKFLQRVVASAFKDKTVLTIAHRVSTIRECDTIWVLREGAVIECDSPENLLANENSEFYAMVQANK